MEVIRTMKEISVIIPTYNRSSLLINTLNAVIKQSIDNSRYEIIIVDDGSTDQTEEIVRRFMNEHDNIAYIKHPSNLGKGAACNTGINATQSPLVVFIDDDIIPAEHWLEAHLNRHKKENKNISVTGLVMYPKEWEKHNNRVKFANFNYAKNIKLSELNANGLPPNRWAGGNTSVAKKIILEAGGFPGINKRGEDVELGYKLYKMGVPLLFEQKALVFHYSEIIKDIKMELLHFRKHYYNAPKLISINPELFQTVGHWFLFPIDKRYDNLFRIIIKVLLNIFISRRLQKIALSIERLTYNKDWLYFKPLYQYIFACEAKLAFKEGLKELNNIKR